MPDFTYEKFRRVCYETSGATYIPVCPKCGRFAKADEVILANIDGMASDRPNATCSKCGRVHMPFEGYIGED